MWLMLRFSAQTWVTPGDDGSAGTVGASAAGPNSVVGRGILTS